MLGIISLATSVILMSMNGDTLALGEQNKGYYAPVLFISIILALWIGMRPVTSVFGDTINYAIIYRALDTSEFPSLSFSSEWGWEIFTYLCKLNGLHVSTYFTIIAVLYTLTGLWAMKRFVPTSPFLGMLFLVGSAFFFSYGTNGLRNGLACNLTLLFMAYALEERYAKAALMAIIALSIHRSVMLPIVSTVVTLTLVRNPFSALYIWIGSIICSLFFNEFFSSLVSLIRIDSRIDLYLSASENTLLTDAESGGFFRWDFLLYSALPIIYFLYINSKGVRDGWFNTLIITYLLSNSLWILLIRTAFSNRFAYLSWFLMPVIFVYPLCNMRAWANQNQAAGIILFLYISMSIIMCLLFFL